ncbi:MAG: Rnf-Nqr domain containing protein [Clostridia bacterium]
MILGFTQMLTAAMYAMLVQNLVLNSVFGICEAIRIAKYPKHFFMHFIAIIYFCFTTSSLTYVVQENFITQSLETIYVFMISCIILAVVYLLTGLLMKVKFKANKKFMNSLGFCAFNSLVMSIPMIDDKAGYNFFQVVGNSVGAAVAFVMAIILINAGMRHIKNNKNIPKIFEGTPVILIYVAILTLAISCLSTDTLFV